MLNLIILLNVSVMRQHIVCMCVYVVSVAVRAVDRPTSQQQIQHINTNM